MRVIGGSFRGRKLSTFKGARIRPTTDRVRESVFNILAAFMPCERALDLYAGTGAMGIEALSRGVKEVHFVESNGEAAGIIEENIEAFELSGRAKIFKQDVAGFLNERKGGAKTERKAGYDLIFVDPPYNAGLHISTLKALGAGGVLATGAVVVAEAGKREPIDEEALKLGFTGLKQIDFRKYGDSLIYIFKRND